MKTVFVVDDSGINLSMADDALSDHYDVITIASASTMFELIEKIIPDIILLDIMMPDMDGFEAMRRLRAEKKSVEIPVIFLTSKNDTVTESLGYEMGAADFIMKPFNREMLLDRIESILKAAENSKTAGE